MAEKYDWQNDGGIFIAEDINGYKLAEDIDQIFSSGNPRQYIEEHYPNVTPDIVPRSYSLKERLAMGALLGLIALGAVTGSWLIGNEFIDALNKLRSGFQ